MTEPAGEKDQNAQPIQQHGASPPDAAAIQPLPETQPLASDNRLNDDDDDSDAYLNRVFADYKNQQAAVPPVVTAPAPPAEQAPVPAIQPQQPAATPQVEAQQPEGKLPQRRFRVDDPKEDQVLALVQNGVPSTMAVAAVYGSTAPVAPVAAAAAPESTPAPQAPAALPAADALKALTDEITALTQQLEGEDIAYDEATQRRITAEIARKTVQRQDAVIAAQAEAQQAQEQAAARYEAERAAEWAGIVAQCPEWDHPNSAMRQEADRIFAAMKQHNDPRLNDPSITSIVFQMASALRGGPPVSPASAPALQAPASAPAPAPVARVTPAIAGGAPPPPVREFTADELEDLMERDPAAANRILAQYPAFNSGRQR